MTPSDPKSPLIWTKIEAPYVWGVPSSWPAPYGVWVGIEQARRNEGMELE